MNNRETSAQGAPPPSRELTPTEFWKEFAPHVAEFQRSYGCLVSLDDKGASIAKGTAVLVSVDSKRVLVTAAHVVNSEIFRSGRVHLLMPPRLEALDGKTSVPFLTPVALDKVIWISKEWDVAVILAPELPHQTEALFLDSCVQEEIVSLLRKRTEERRASLPMFVLGFPNFGHLVDKAGGVETLASLPLPAFLTQLDEIPCLSVSVAGKPPQLTVEVDAHDDAADTHGSEDIAALFRRNLKEDSAEEPFGGYSGGPVALGGREGLFLIGTVKEGGSMYGTYRVFASAWDEAASALRASAEWKSLSIPK